MNGVVKKAVVLTAGMGLRSASRNQGSAQSSAYRF